MILIKWWARLQFVIDMESQGMVNNQGYYQQDFFKNSSQERAMEYIFVHYLQEKGVVQPLTFSTVPGYQVGCSVQKPRTTTQKSSVIELKEAIKLVHDFFYHMLFEFDIKKIINAVPINREGLHKVFGNQLKPHQKAQDDLKIIYYARNNKSKISWLLIQSGAVKDMFVSVAQSLIRLNKGSSDAQNLKDCFLPADRC